MLPCNDFGNYRGFGYKLGKMYHIGHDFNQPEGTVIKSVSDGTVIKSFECAEFGSKEINGKREPGGVIIIKHKNRYCGSFFALYGHVKRYVNVTDDVKEGQSLGTLIPYYISSKERADHLHFVICVLGTFPNGYWGYRSDLTGFINPLDYLNKFC